MRPINISEITEGVIIAKNIVDNHGNVLLRNGTTIRNKQIIARLRELGITTIYINDEWSADIFIEPVVDETLANATYEALIKLDVEKVNEAASQIVDKLSSSAMMYDDMQHLRDYDEYTFAHSLNVAIAATTLGIGLGLNYWRLKNLTAGAILHDIGKQNIPLTIINKKDKLTPAEMNIVRKHPEDGYLLLKDKIEITSSMRGVILQHHEDWNGTGYPKGLKGKDIYDLAHIVHICDVWDALVSERSYKKAFSIKDTIQILEHDRGKKFSPDLLDAFFKYVPIYNKGSLVTLSDGREALIYNNNRLNMLRPTVIFKDKTILDLRNSDLEILT